MTDKTAQCPSCLNRSQLYAKQADEVLRIKQVVAGLLRCREVREASDAQWLCLLNMDYGEDVDGTPLIDAIEKALEHVPEAWVDYDEGKRLREERDSLRAKLAEVEAERERLRHLCSKQLDEIQNLNDMADAVECLRDIGKLVGCGHVDGPDERRQLINCVDQSFASAEEAKEAAERRAEEAEGKLQVSIGKENNLLSRVIATFMEDALVAIAGAVCTPEKGYLEDGGLVLLLGDIKRLRAKYEDAEGRVKEIQKAIRNYDIELKLQFRGGVAADRCIDAIRAAVTAKGA